MEGEVMINKQAKQPRLCSECGALLMNAKNYAVCVEGCGKLHPKLSRDDEKLNHAKVLGIPEATKATQYGEFYFISGARYRKGRKYTGKLDSKPKKAPGEETAIWEGKVYRFERCVETDV